jgi:hypothetical protein
MSAEHAAGPEGFDPARVRCIHSAQLGGIETSVLDDGPGRGVRIAWVNTGSPLRYKVLIDRGLDIAEAFHGGRSLAFLSLTGPTTPSRGLDRGLDWLRGFYGGLVCSCGPEHIGAPIEEGGIEYGLHGRHSNTPAAVEAVRQPDPAAGADEMSITGIVRNARMFGPNVELRRTIRSILGRPELHIRDRFVNRGNEPARHAWLLHVNLGWPLLDEGARLVYQGQVRARADSVARFADPAVYRTVPAPLAEHVGTGEDVGFIDPPADTDGFCHVGLVNHALPLGVEIIYPRAAFPVLANWQHFAPGGEYVTGLEPNTGGMPGDGHEAGSLAPGEVKDYQCTIRVLEDADELRRFEEQWA